MNKYQNDLLDKALEAHGGFERWKKFRGMASTIRTGGKLWAFKGTPLPSVPRRAVTEFHRQWTQVAPFGQLDWTMTWTPGHVAITNRDGATIAERDDGRKAFDRSFGGQWDPLNLAYFNGYAMWTYHAAPFVFGERDYEVRDIEPIESDSELLRGILVKFPERIHSHSQEQRFYFTADGLVRRHDYTVDVWADVRAAHFMFDYVDVEGLKYPTRRSVFTVKPDGSLDQDFNAVTIELSDYAAF
ncbi:hypothetical protein ACI2KT_34475 [Ensifer adhaerens]|uniref:hypothetical protein n=1 Tax=Ensifer adhaerens TaxID=106592 RepID=UPI00384D2863